MNIKDLKKTNKKEITEEQKEDNMLSNLGLSREDLNVSGDRDWETNTAN